MMNLSVCVAVAYKSDSNADVILWDLDSVRPSPCMTDARIIGFTRRYEPSRVDPNRLCYMIMHRPFEMRLMREELIACLLNVGNENPVSKSTLRLEGQVLHCNGSQVTLSVAEARVMQCLLDNRPNPVSRNVLSSLIGASSSNKVDVYVCYLRRKLNPYFDRPLICTVRGNGYRLADTNEIRKQ